MKLKICLLGLLCLFFQASSQTKPTIKFLEVGDKVPDITINNIINYPAKTAKVSDFKGKLLILDFWATWCSPCVAMIPKMDSLQNVFKGSVQFLPVAYQNSKEIHAFYNNLKTKRGISNSLPEVTGDTILRRLFPHAYLPHYVWINQAGIVCAITGYQQVNSTAIKAILNNEKTAIPQKNDTQLNKYDPDKPLFVGNNGGDGRSVLFHSMISGYSQGLPAGYNRVDKGADGLKITCRNQTLLSLYRIAYGDKAFFGKNRTVLETKDSSILTPNMSGTAYQRWMEQGNVFCYELVAPAGMADSASSIMLGDLNRFFRNYDIKLENQRTKCLALVRTSKTDKIRSKGGESASEFNGFGFKLQNFPLARLIAQLNFIYLQNYPLPIVDATGYKEWVDIEVHASPSDIQATNEELKHYDLELRETEMTIEKMVVRDRSNKSNLN